MKNINIIEEVFILRAYIISIFLKLTSGAKNMINYRGSRSHSIITRQNPNEFLKILLVIRL